MIIIKRKKRYLEHCREVNGFTHKDLSLCSSRNAKQWRLNIDHFRHELIGLYGETGLIPCFLVTVSYYDCIYDRSLIQKRANRISKVIVDFFNRYGKAKYHISLDHFIERFGDKLDGQEEHKTLVFNTVTQEMESDWCNREIVRGGFHSHFLVSHIPDEIILTPGTRVMKALKGIYGSHELPMHLMSQGRIEDVKCDLLNFALRDRCDFIGNSDRSLDVRPVRPDKRFDGYLGWKGVVAYVTKKMYNSDQFLEVYDHINSNILTGVR